MILRMSEEHENGVQFPDPAPINIFVKGFNMSKSGLEKIPMDVGYLITSGSIKFPAVVPVIITHGDSFRIIVKVQEMLVDNHDSDMKPYQLIMKAWGIVQCVLYFDDDDDELFFHIGIPEERKNASVV